MPALAQLGENRMLLLFRIPNPESLIPALKECPLQPGGSMPPHARPLPRPPPRLLDARICRDHADQPCLHRARGGVRLRHRLAGAARSEQHTSELQSLMRISYAVFCLKKKKKQYYKCRRRL